MHSTGSMRCAVPRPHSVVLLVVVLLMMLLLLHVHAGGDVFVLGGGDPVPVIPVHAPDQNTAAEDEELAGKVLFIVLSREESLATLVRAPCS